MPKNYHLFKVVENRMQQCCAARIVHSCQQYCSALLHLIAGWFRLNNAEQYCWQLQVLYEQCGQHNIVASYVLVYSYNNWDFTSLSVFVLTHPVNFPVGGNRSARRKPTTFGRVLTDSFHMSKALDSSNIEKVLAENRTRNLRGERPAHWPLRHRSPLFKSSTF